MKTYEIAQAYKIDQLDFEGFLFRHGIETGYFDPSVDDKDVPRLVEQYKIETAEKATKEKEEAIVAAREKQALAKKAGIIMHIEVNAQKLDLYNDHVSIKIDKKMTDIFFNQITAIEFTDATRLVYGSLVFNAAGLARMEYDFWQGLHNINDGKVSFSYKQSNEVRRFADLAKEKWQAYHNLSQNQYNRANAPIPTSYACPRCGSAISFGATKCSSCGQDIIWQ